MNLDRRQFLVRATIGASSAVSVVVFGCNHDPVVIELGDVFGDPSDAIAIGRSYLLQYPEEADRGTLVTQTLDANETAIASRLRQALRRRIRSDFAASRVFGYNGWVLSRTEGRLAALAVLDSGSG